MTIISFNQIYYPASPFNLTKIACNRTNNEIILFTKLEEDGQLKDLVLELAYNNYWIFCNN